MRKLWQHITIRSILGIVLLLVVFSVIVSWIGYNGFTDALLTQYADGAFLTAKAARRYVDAEWIDEYVTNGPETNEYRAVRTQLDRLCNSTGSTFIYVIIPDRSDYAHIAFIFSVKRHESHYQLYSFGYVRETTNDEYREKYRLLCEEGSERELVVRDQGYIETDPHITAMIPLTKEDGTVKGILCVQRQMDSLVETRQHYQGKIVIALIVLVVLAIIGQSAFLNHTLLLPLRKIAREAVRFSTENVAAETKLRETIRSSDEVGELASSIDIMEEQIQQYVENLTKATAEKQRIRTELELGTRIQAGMLPDTFPAFPDRTEFDLYALMDPAREVGGDFYDFFLVDEDHLCILIADVSGKGVPAALFMMASKIILANNAMSRKTPAQILTDTNTAICANNPEEMFVTVWLGILEISSGKLTAASAGHEYPFVKHAGGQFELFKDKHGFVIGGMDGVRYKEYELQMKPDSVLLLYTDGVPEATAADGTMFGTKRMLDVLNRDSADSASAEQILRTVRSAVDEFVKEAEQFDDMTMLCIEYKGNTPPVKGQ